MHLRYLVTENLPITQTVSLSAATPIAASIKSGDLEKQRSCFAHCNPTWPSRMGCCDRCFQPSDLVRITPLLNIEKYPETNGHQRFCLHGCSQLMAGEPRAHESMCGSSSVHHHSASNGESRCDPLWM
jgi:hypothetical protein